MTDPVADFITRLRNSSRIGRESVTVPASELKFQLAKILQTHHYLADVKKIGKGAQRFLELDLAYTAPGDPAIKEIRRISKPGKRVYASYKELKPVKSGMGISVLSTPKGLRTNREAFREKLGGEILIEVA